MDSLNSGECNHVLCWEPLSVSGTFLISRVFCQRCGQQRTNEFNIFSHAPPNETLEDWERALFAWETTNKCLVEVGFKWNARTKIWDCQSKEARATEEEVHAELEAAIKRMENFIQWIDEKIQYIRVNQVISIIKHQLPSGNQVDIDCN